MSKKLLYLLVFVLLLGVVTSVFAIDYSPYISDEFVLHWPDPTRAYPDIPLDFRFVAYEIHNSPLTWELIGEPAGMTIDQDGNVDWTPTTGDIGSYNITVKVTRDAGGFIQRAFTLYVNTTDFMFVATGGSDSTGDGSLGSPYGTIEHAMRQITNGNGKTIYVRGGTYHEAYSWEAGGIISPLRAKDFSAADPVEIRSYPGENAILDSDLSGHGLWYYDTSYVIFSNLEAREASNRGGGLFASGSQHVMIRDSVVRECHWNYSNNCTGYMAQGCDDIIFDRCEGYNNNDPGQSHWNSSNFLIYTEGGSSSNVNYIQNCLSEDTISGFKIKHAGPRRLIVHNCVSIDDNIPYGGASDYSSFRYSVAYNGGGISLGITDPNPYMNGGMLVEHMTIVTGGGVGLSTQDGYLEEGSVIQNNIFYNSSSARVMQFWQWTEDMSPFNVTSDKNVFYSTSEVGLVRYGHVDYSFSGWKGLGYDLNSLFADPLFNDRPNGDFNIPLNSPANFGGGEFAGAFAPGGGTPQPPGQASNPSPADSATDVSVDADLSWSAGSGSTSSDVYFGTDSTPDSGELQGNQTATTFDPGTM
ncbi:MAG: putative Ig domain-containing protein, partial [Planctomycetota bacterium]